MADADDDDDDDGSISGVGMAEVIVDDTVASVSEVCDDDLLVGMGHP